MIKWSYVNKLASAAITASSAVATLPATNAVNYLKQKVWRSTALSSQWLKFDQGAAAAIRFMAIVGHNLTSGATVHFQMNATDVWTAPSVDVTVTWNQAIMLYEWASDQSYRWIRISISDASNPDGYLEIGVAWGGVEASPSRNAKEYRIVPIDPSAVEESADGAETGAIKIPYNLITFGFRNIDYAAFKTLWKAVGRWAFFFIILDYDNEILTDGRHDLSFYGRIDQPPDFGSTFRDRGNIELTMKESR